MEDWHPDMTIIKDENKDKGRPGVAVAPGEGKEDKFMDELSAMHEKHFWESRIQMIKKKVIEFKIYILTFHNYEWCWDS